MTVERPNNNETSEKEKRSICVDIDLSSSDMSTIKTHSNNIDSTSHYHFALLDDLVGNKMMIRTFKLSCVNLRRRNESLCRFNCDLRVGSV